MVVPIMTDFPQDLQHSKVRISTDACQKKTDHLQILNVSFPRRPRKREEVRRVLGITSERELHKLRLRYAAFGTGQKECRNGFLPDASFGMWGRLTQVNTTVVISPNSVNR